MNDISVYGDLSCARSVPRSHSNNNCSENKCVNLFNRKGSNEVELLTMPLSCVAYGCTNHNRMSSKPGFFRFPNNDPDLRQKWINACKRQNEDGTPWNPRGPNVFICGDHFITGMLIL